MALKKQWYEIVAPDMFKGQIVGETLAVEPKQLIGRKLEVSILELMRDYSRFYIKLILKVDRIEGQKAYTKLMGHDVMRERVYRMVRRHGRRVDVIEDVRTKDGTDVRVKVVFVLIKRVGKSKKDITRAVARQRVKEIVPTLTFEELMSGILSGDIAAEIRKDASKAYPIATIEIRKTEVIEPRKKQEIQA